MLVIEDPCIKPNHDNENLVILGLIEIKEVIFHILHVYMAIKNTYLDTELTNDNHMLT